MIPYTYLITEISTGIRYYGSQYGKNADPNNLGDKYISSSLVLKPKILANPANFKFEVRKIFTRPEDAVKWEHKVLRRLNVIHREDWYNDSNGTEHRQDWNVLREKNKAKYGKEHWLQTKEILNKQHATNLERYGVENVVQNEEVIRKKERTNQKRYGNKHAIASEAVRNKSKQSFLKNLGVEWPLQSEIVKSKAKKTNLKNRGTEWPMQSEEVQEKSKNTLLEKYGVTNISQLESNKQKVRATMIKRYGGSEKRYNSTIIQNILNLYFDGLTDTKIAKQLGLAQAPVSRHLRSMNLPANGRSFRRKF